MVSQALQSAGVECAPVIEAAGWEVMLHFVQLGFGATIVNACCRLPTGVTGIRLPELPQIQYHLFRSRKPLSSHAASLHGQLLEWADAWKKRSTS